MAAAKFTPSSRQRRVCSDGRAHMNPKTFRGTQPGLRMRVLNKRRAPGAGTHLGELGTETSLLFLSDVRVAW